MYSCDEILDLLSARLDGALSCEEAAALDAHLEGCPGCRALADDLAALHAELPGSLAAEAPPALLENVMAHIRAEAAPIPFPTPGEGKRAWRRWGTLVAAVALVVLTGTALRFAAHPDGSTAGAPAGTSPLLAVNDHTPLPTSEPVPSPVGSQQTAPIQENAVLPDSVEGQSAGNQAQGDIPTPAPVPSADLFALPPSPEPEPATPGEGGGTGKRAVPESAPPCAIRAPLPSATTAPEDAPADPPLISTFVTTTQVPPQCDTADGTLTDTDACRRVYELLFAANYPDAVQTEEDGSTGYILTPYQAPGDQGRSSSLRLRYWGTGEGGRYYLCLVYENLLGAPGAAEPVASPLYFLALPVAGGDQVLQEPADPAAYADEADYDAARIAFWDTVNS